MLIRVKQHSSVDRVRSSPRAQLLATAQPTRRGFLCFLFLFYSPTLVSTTCFTGSVSDGPSRVPSAAGQLGRRGQDQARCSAQTSVL